MTYDNTSRTIITNQQLSVLFERFFGDNGEKRKATTTKYNGTTSQTLHTLSVDTTTTVFKNKDTHEFYVVNLVGRIASTPTVKTLYVNTEKQITVSFDVYHKPIASLGVTIGQIHDLVKALTK